MFSDFNAESILTSNYVAGKSLFSLLQDPYLPKLYRDFLNNQYERFVKEISEYLIFPNTSKFTRAPVQGYFPETLETNLSKQPTIYGFVIYRDAVMQNFSEEYKQAMNSFTPSIRMIAEKLISGTTIIIKSDNIIVDEYFNLHLVDPN